MALPGTFCIGIRVKGDEEVISGTASLLLVNGHLVGVTAKHIFLELVNCPKGQLLEEEFEILTGKLVIRGFNFESGETLREWVPIPFEGNVISTLTCAQFEELDVAFFKLNQDVAVQACFDWEGSPLWVDFDLTMDNVGTILGMEDRDTGAYSAKPYCSPKSVLKFGAASATTEGSIFGFSAKKVIVKNKIGEFATDGDSGGMAFEKDTGLALGVVTGLSQTAMNRVVPTWAFSKALYMLAAPKVRHVKKTSECTIFKGLAYGLRLEYVYKQVKNKIASETCT